MYGQVDRAYAIRDLKGKSKHFGYVNFHSEEIARNLVNAKYIFTPDNKRIYCKAYKKGAKQESGNSYPPSKNESLSEIDSNFSQKFNNQQHQYMNQKFENSIRLNDKPIFIKEDHGPSLNTLHHPNSSIDRLLYPSEPNPRIWNKPEKKLVFNSNLLQYHSLEENIQSMPISTKH